MNITTKLVAAALVAAALSGCEVHDAAADERQCFEDMTAAAQRYASDFEPTDACLRFARNEMRKRDQS